jgi:HNH endonuclease/NUMOD4 motif
MATNIYKGEQWKPVKIDLGQTNINRIEVSNFGRVRSFNQISDGNILEGSLINGYRIIRLKFFSPREEKMVQNLAYHQKQVDKFAKKIVKMRDEGATKTAIKEANTLLEGLKKNLKKKYAEDTKLRTLHYHSLVHRLVATYFLKQPTDKHTIVAHLDYDKLNNRPSNLKWMTQPQNVLHQQDSPYVIADKASRRNGIRAGNRMTKLSVTKVMLLKKLLNEGKEMKKLVKQFKVTDTQILRIKRGENWGDVQAAK